jgi:hypothetical protein
LLDVVLFHNGEVDGVAGGHPLVSQANFFRSLCHGAVDGEGLVDDAEDGVERWLDGVVTVDDGVAVWRISCSTSASVTNLWRSLTSFSSRRWASLL